MTESANPEHGRFLYMFLDEGGNFDFSVSGTKCFTMTSVVMVRPFGHVPDLVDLRYDLTEEGYDLEYFHAAEDEQCVRDRVFEVIETHGSSFQIDSVIVEKRKCGPALRPVEKFYPRMLGYLVKWTLRRFRLSEYDCVFIYTDAIPVKKKRRAIEKGVKMQLAQLLPSGCSYRMEHHESKSNVNLQVADYCNWAIYRKWSRGDNRSYDRVRRWTRSEFDIFRTGTTHYY